MTWPFRKHQLPLPSEPGKEEKNFKKWFTFHQTTAEGKTKCWSVPYWTWMRPNCLLEKKKEKCVQHCLGPHDRTHGTSTWQSVMSLHLHFFTSFFLQVWLPNTPPAIRKGLHKPFAQDQTSLCSWGGRKALQNSLWLQPKSSSKASHIAEVWKYRVMYISKIFQKIFKMKWLEWSVWTRADGSCSELLQSYLHWSTISFKMNCRPITLCLLAKGIKH